MSSGHRFLSHLRRCTFYHSERLINQSIKFLYPQYPQHSQAQWHSNRIGVQRFWYYRPLCPIQSINQISIAPIFPAKPGSVAQQLNRWSKAKSIKHRACWCLWRKVKSKRCVFRRFLKITFEVAEQTDSGRLFQWEWAQEWKALAPMLVLVQQSNSFVWSQWPRWEWCGKHGVKTKHAAFHLVM